MKSSKQPATRASAGRVLHMPALIEPVDLDFLRFEAQQLLEIRAVEQEIQAELAARLADVDDCHRQLGRAATVRASINEKIDDMLERLGRGAQIA